MSLNKYVYKSSATSILIYKAINFIIVSASRVIAL